MSSRRLTRSMATTPETSSGNQAPLPGTRGEDLSAKEEIGKGVSAQKGKKRKQRRGMKGLERSDLQPSNETSGPRAPKKRKTEEVSSAGQGASELGESERGAAEQVDRENQSGAGIDHILKDYDLEVQCRIAKMESDKEAMCKSLRNLLRTHQIKISKQMREMKMKEIIAQAEKEESSGNDAENVLDSTASVLGELENMINQFSWP